MSRQRHDLRHTKDILIQAGFGVFTITLNWPDRLHAFRSQTLKELATALKAAERDRATRVIVIAGAGGKAFSVGGDISEMKNLNRRTGEVFVRQLNELATAFLDSTKPVIAKVDGYCIGGGNEIQLFCDLTIASNRSVFGQVGPKVGSSPLWGGTQILPLLVGLKKAKEMIYLCRRYSAAEAVAMGLINEAVSESELDARVNQVCRELIEKSPQSLRLTRRSLHYGLKQRIAAGLKALGRIYGSPELTEGMQAFLEKRPPKF